MKSSILLALLIYGLNISLFAQSPDDFVTTWFTLLPGTSNNSSIEIHTEGEGYNYDVDWNNDGVFDDIGVTGNISHDFLTSGTYSVRIRGDFPTLNISAGGDKNKLLEVNQWGSISWSNLSSALSDCAFVTVVALDAPDLSNVTDLSHMFESASGNHHVSHWDVGSIENMNSMFFGTHGFDENLGSWDISNVSDMTNMFNDVELSIPNYDSLLIGWAAQNIHSGINFHGGLSQSCSWDAVNSRENLINDNLWEITDAGQNESCAATASCDADFDGNNIINGDDFSFFLGNFDILCGLNCIVDLDDNNIINGEDFAIFLGNFGLNCE